MDQPKIERVLRLMKLLSSESVDYTVTELGNKLEMSPRTIYRYIDTFKDAGFALHKYGTNTYKLIETPKPFKGIENLIFFSEEEAYLVNSLIDQLQPTNKLKANLKSKLSAIYNFTNIAEYVSDKSNAAHVESLGKAINSSKKVILKNYESGSSRTIRDRWIEPFGFTTDYIDVWGYDLEDGQNKVFKISRIGEVVMSDENWTEKHKHRRLGMDIFRMNGKRPIHVRLQLSFFAKNLLSEEFPLSGKYLHEADAGIWILDTEVYSLLGIGRFVAGLMGEIKVLEGEALKDYLKSYGEKYFANI